MNGMKIVRKGQQYARFLRSSSSAQIWTVDSTDADAVAARRNQGEDLGAVGHGARSVERAISSVASPSPRGEWEISRAPSMKVRRWLYLMRYFAALVIDKAPDVLFVVVTVTFVLFLLFMAI